MALVVGTIYTQNGTRSGGSNSNNYAGIDYQVVSQDIENNTSLLRVRPWISKNANTTGAWNYDTQTMTIKGDGQTKTTKTVYDLRGTVNNNKYYLASDYPFKRLSGDTEPFDFVVSHDSNGIKICNIYAFIPLDNTASTGNYIVNINVELPVIPRSSTPILSSNSFNIGDTITITMNKAVETFTHDIRAEFLTWSKTLATNVDSYVWDTSLDANNLYNELPTTNSGIGKIYVDTYSEDTLIGTKSVDFTAKVVNSNPIFSNFTYKDTNTKTVTVTGDNQVLIKNYSNLLVTIPSANKMVALNSAAEKNYSAVIDNRSISKEYSVNDLEFDLTTIQSAGTKKLTVRAYDSRNNSTAVEKNIVIYDYEKPVVYAELSRLNNFEEETTLKVKGNYFPININGVSKNNIATNGIQYRYRETEGTWTEWGNLPFTTDSEKGTFTCPDFVVNLDRLKSYEFEIKCIDSITETILSDDTTKIDIGVPLFFISSNLKVIGVNCIPPSDATEGSIWYKNATGEEKPVLDYEIVDSW